eukprot:jgi/Hompol1/473/HPOL_002504-RA
MSLVALGLVYAANVIGTGLLVASAFAHEEQVSAYALLYVSRQRLAQLATVASEFPMAVLVPKLALVAVAARQRLFVHALLAPLYWLDVAVMLALWALFLQSYFARYCVFEATRMLVDRSSLVPPPLISFSFWFRFLNPFWEVSPRNLGIHENICYATQAELEQAGVRSKYLLSLDIYHHPSMPRNCPVVIFIHGGSFRGGSKDIHPPFIPYLALMRYVVVAINYRLSPAVKYPSHLIDVKRAIRWVRTNIHKYGGNPSFIVVCGGSSGGHLATMAALTQNEAQYQPGFENIDTSIQCVVSISGIYDLVDEQNEFKFDLKGWFCSEIIGSEELDDSTNDMVRQASPTCRLKDAEIKMHLAISNGIASPSTIGLNLPPFMIVHGSADSLAPISHVREFVKLFALVTDAPLSFIEFPNANHLFHMLSSPRGHYLAYGMEPFLRAHYEQHLLREAEKTAAGSAAGSAPAAEATVHLR